MSDAHRGSRSYRDRDSNSDDERYRSTTVTRYKMMPSRTGDRYERSERIEVDDDHRFRFSGRTSATMEPYSDRSRSVYERDVVADRRDPDRSRITVYEGRDDRGHGHEVERYRKKTEYYSQPDPPPPPVVIRQKAPELQKIIVQAAPPPAPIVIPRQQPGVVIRDREQDRQLVRRDRDPHDEEYYYRHERRDVGPYRGDRDYALSRYERRRRDGGHYYSDDDHYVRRERSESSYRHRRQLAEGALAGAGITALMSSHRDGYGDLSENRGRKVLAGAALGALGTEALRRAHSAYEAERWGDGDESPERHSRLNKGLGIAAVALAAGAAKCYQASKIDKEEAHRGRSRIREGYYSADEYSRSPSRSRGRHRSLSTAAKAALGTAATAGIIRHLRDKSKSKPRSRHGSHSRSKSRLRHGAETAGAAGVAGKLWKDRQEKEKEKEEHERSASAREREYYRHSRSRGASASCSRSHSRSMARSPYSPSGADAELGLVEYGREPLPAEPSSAVARDYHSHDEDERRRWRRRRHRSLSSPADQERRRSKSRLRDMAAAGAAGFGIKEFKDRKDREKRERRSREKDEEARRRYDDEPRRGGYFDDDGHYRHHSCRPQFPHCLRRRLLSALPFDPRPVSRRSQIHALPRGLGRPTPRVSAVRAAKLHGLRAATAAGPPGGNPPPDHVNDLAQNRQSCGRSAAEVGINCSGPYGASPDQRHPAASSRCRLSRSRQRAPGR